jgi:sugar O-acyltransferase (sialic acid O-acetyltransferase NeuD family)
LSACKITVERVLDSSVEQGEQILGVPVADINGNNLKLFDQSAVIAIGDNAKRRSVLLEFGKSIYSAPLVHPSALIDPSSKLDRFSQVFAGAYVGPLAEVSNNVIVNTYAIVEHEATIGEDSHIAVGAKILGRAKVGKRCFIGAGAVIKDNVSVCDDVTIGANSFVSKSIYEPGVYVGAPARKLK